MLFMDFRNKCESGELTAKAMDLRGMLDKLLDYQLEIDI